MTKSMLDHKETIQLCDSNMSSINTNNMNNDMILKSESLCTTPTRNAGSSKRCACGKLLLWSANRQTTEPVSPPGSGRGMSASPGAFDKTAVTSSPSFSKAVSVFDRLYQERLEKEKERRLAAFDLIQTLNSEGTFRRAPSRKEEQSDEAREMLCRGEMCFDCARKHAAVKRAVSRRRLLMVAPEAGLRAAYSTSSFQGIETEDRQVKALLDSAPGTPTSVTSVRTHKLYESASPSLPLMPTVDCGESVLTTQMSALGLDYSPDRLSSNKCSSLGDSGDEDDDNNDDATQATARSSSVFFPDNLTEVDVTSIDSIPSLHATKDVDDSFYFKKSLLDSNDSDLMDTLALVTPKRNRDGRRTSLKLSLPFDLTDPETPKGGNTPVNTTWGRPSKPQFFRESIISGDYEHDSCAAQCGAPRVLFPEIIESITDEEGETFETVLIGEHCDQRVWVVPCDDSKKRRRHDGPRQPAPVVFEDYDVDVVDADDEPRMGGCFAGSRGNGTLWSYIVPQRKAE